MPSNNRNIQRKNVKSKATNDEHRRKRENNQVQIRKKQKEEEFLKKRSLINNKKDKNDNNNDETDYSDISLDFINKVVNEFNVGMSKLRMEMPQHIHSISQLSTNEKQHLLKWVRSIREKHCVGPAENPDVMEEFVSSMKKNYEPMITALVKIFCLSVLYSEPNQIGIEDIEIQFECLWIFTDFFSVFDANLVNKIYDIMAPQNDDSFLKSIYKIIDNFNVTQGQDKLVNQAIWTLGNLISDSIRFRNLFVKFGFIDLFENKLEIAVKVGKEVNIDILKNFAWCLSQTYSDHVRPILPLLYCRKVMKMCAQLNMVADNLGDFEILNDILKIVETISDPRCQNSDDDDRYIDIIIEHKMVQSFPNYLINDNAPTLTILSSLRILGNMLSGNEQQTAYILNLGFLDIFYKMMNNPQSKVWKVGKLRKEIMFAISNIAAGTEEQVLTLLNHPVFVEGLFLILEKDTFENKRECIYVLANICNLHNRKFIDFLISKNLLKQLEECLVSKDNKIVILALEAIYEILEVKDELQNIVYLELITEKTDIVDIIESLQDHDSDKVYDLSLEILEKHFGEDDEDDFANLQPTVNNGQQTFSFGFNNNNNNNMKFDLGHNSVNQGFSTQNANQSTSNPFLNASNPFA